MKKRLIKVMSALVITTILSVGMPVKQVQSAPLQMSEQAQRTLKRRMIEMQFGMKIIKEVESKYGTYYTFSDGTGYYLEK